MIIETIFSCELDEEEEDTFEIDLVKQYCQHYGMKLVYNEIPSSEFSIVIPIGSVEWCEKIYGEREPEYYPLFLKKWFGRNIFRTKYIEVKNQKIFVKPASHYKQFGGKVNKYPDHEIDDDTEVWCSEIVHFSNEWRYYILNGEVLDSAWYDGDISDKDVINNHPDLITPKLPQELLKCLKENGYYGTLDMGAIDGKDGIYLVEASHPYANGWYTESYQNYGLFLIESDKYLKVVDVKN